jgi:phosphatidylglycerol:prolipoprotein diacylglycerol transferase
VKPIPVSFHIGPLLIHTYGIGLAVTFWFAYRYFDRRLRKNGYTTQWLTGVFLWVVVASIVGARAVHVLSDLSYYGSNPGQIIQVWHGGLSSFGGLLLGIPTGVLLARKRCPELGVVKGLDLVAPVLMASWGIGRLLGPQLMVAGGGARTTAWYGMEYAGQVGKRVPVPIIQSFDSFVIFGILLLLERRFRDRPAGFMIAATAGLWGLGRFYEEFVFLRQSSPQGSLAVEITGLCLFAAGLAVMGLLIRRHHMSGATGGDAGTLDPEAEGLLDSGSDSHVDAEQDGASPPALRVGWPEGQAVPARQVAAVQAERPAPDI